MLSPLRVAETSLEEVTATCLWHVLLRPRGRRWDRSKFTLCAKRTITWTRKRLFLARTTSPLSSQDGSTEPPSSTKYSVAHEGKGGLNRAIDRSRLGEAGWHFFRPPRMTRAVRRDRVRAQPAGREGCRESHRRGGVDQLKVVDCEDERRAAANQHPQCREREHDDHTFVGVLVTQAIRCLSPKRVLRSQTSDGTVYSGDCQSRLAPPPADPALEGLR